ncbi:hypothetical protein AAE121_002320 [Salmonella enterica]
MDAYDVFVWPDGSWLYREDYSELSDRCLGEYFNTLYVGTRDYNVFFDICPDDDEGGPDEDYWPDNN